MTTAQFDNAPDSVESMTPHQRKTAKKAALSAFLGSTIEYYDFIAFATASALVFNHIFFGGLGGRASLIASFATFGVAYVARPLGAVIFGALGDRIGRSRTLIYSLALMGAATFIIGLLPTTATIGISAPIILAVMRLLQGVSAGGEQAGSNALTAEHAPKDKRGLYTGWTMVGVVLGTSLGSAVFSPIAAIGHDFLLSWGWRIPFLIAGPLILFTMYIRRQVGETASFQQVQREQNSTRHRPALAHETTAQRKIPLVEVITGHWPALVRIILCSLYALTGTMLSVLGVNYGVEQQGLDGSKLLLIVSIVGLIGVPISPLYAKLSDRIGRRPVFIGSVLFLAVAFFGFFASLGSHNYWLIFVAAAALMAGGAAGNVVQAPMYTEMFPTRVRYTGYAVGTQVGLILVGFSPSIATALMGSGPNGWVPIAIFIAVCMIIAALSALTIKETKGASIDELDAQYERGSHDATAARRD